MPSQTSEPRHDAVVGRSFLRLGTGEALARLIAFGATAYLARRLGADVYGTIALASAMLLYLACMTDCGIEMLGISDVARQPSGITELLPSILVGRLVVAAILVVIVSGVGLFLMPQPDGALLAGYALTLGAVAFGTQWVHLGLQQSGSVALVRVGAEALTALLIVLLVRGPGDVAGAPLAQVIGQGAGAFVLLRLLPGGAAKLGAVLRAEVVASVFRRSWPLVLHALLGLAIFNSDFLFLRIFRDSASVGYYAVAYTLVSFFLNLGVSYSMGLLPVLARLRSVPDDERRLHDSAMAQVFAGALPVAIGGCLLAHSFITVLFGEGYQPAAPALQVLIWSIPFALFRNVAQAVLISHDRQGQLLRTVVVAAGLNLLLNVTLIPLWGSLGAAVATVLTEAIRTAVVLGYSREAGLPFDLPAAILACRARGCGNGGRAAGDAGSLVGRGGARCVVVLCRAHPGRRVAVPPGRPAGARGMSRIASGESALATFVQSAPRLLSLVRQMRPTWELPALSALDAEFLHRERIRGLVWDVDGTLTGDRRPALVPEAMAPFQALLAAPDTRHVILSNAGEARFLELGTMFPAIPLLRAYLYDGNILYRKFHLGVDSWAAGELEARMVEGARVIRKPSAVLVDYAVRELGCERGAVVMVGDQYLTDVAGANLGGVRSVKLPTLAPETFRRMVRMSQRVEELVYRLLYPGRRGAMARR